MQTVRDLLVRPSRWLRRSGPEADVVLSSRVQLARNLSQHKFPQRADEQGRADVLRLVLEASEEIDNLQNGLFLDFDSLDPLDRQVLSERQLNDSDSVTHPDQCGLVVSGDELLSVRVNAEDHLQMQALMSGLDLQAAFDACDLLDVELDSRLDFAYSESYGFLTAAPARAGTGLQAAALLRLPALSMRGDWKMQVTQLGEQNVLVQGFRAAGTPEARHLFLVTNGTTRGQREGEIVRSVDLAVRELVDRELEERQRQLSGAQRLLVDRIWRSYGILSQARLLGAHETLHHASMLLLGVQLEQLEVPSNVLDEIFSFSQEGHTRVRFESDAGNLAIEEWRAERVRNELQGLNS